MHLVKGPGAPSGDASVKKEIAPKRQPGDDGVACWISHESRETSGARTQCFCGMWPLTRWSSTLMGSTVCGMEICLTVRLLRIGRLTSSKIGLAGEFGGELEILALARTLDLTFCIVRPGQPTVHIGKGKAVLWLLLQNRHYEPLSTSADGAAVACRAHAMRSVGIVSGKKMRGGGKSQTS